MWLDCIINNSTTKVTYGNCVREYDMKHFKRELTELTFTCLKLTIKALEKDVKYAQS